ncbi:MAG: hypothetical protein VB144_14165 [Clostridia bacterium]|nr:hypothetical protein [Clostridia bacterium]
MGAGVSAGNRRLCEMAGSAESWTWRLSELAVAIIAACLIVASSATAYAVPGATGGVNQSGAATGPSVIVRYALTCNGLRDGLPVDFDDTFDASDPFVQAYVRLQVIDGPVKLTERWYDPEGRVIAVREYPGFTGGPVYNYIGTAKLAPGQTLLPVSGGWYRVELTVNESPNPLVSAPFMYDAHG